MRIGPALAFLALLAASCVVEEEPTPIPEPDETPAPTPAGPPPLVRGLELIAVTFNQGAEGRLVRGGDVLTDSSIPVIAGRGGLLRGLVAPSDDWDRREVVAELELFGAPEDWRDLGDDLDAGDDDDSAPADEDPWWTDRKEISGYSDSGDLGSTFNFDLPPEVVLEDVEYAITLREAEHGLDVEGVDEGARMPAAGSAPLHALDWGGVVRIHIIPVQYMADGSGRIPSIDDERIGIYKSWFERLYPVREVVLEVGEVHVSEQEILADGTGMSEHLELMTDLREERGIPWDRYVYGLLTPAPEDERPIWCASGCTLGLSYRARNPNSDHIRVSVGNSFEADRSARTFLHEVGHAHDRGHADCGGVSNADPEYPYSGGSIGTWGWDLQDKVLVDPGGVADLMGYCSPWWFSDYTFEALWDRIHMLEGLNDQARTKQPYRVVSVRPTGKVEVRHVRQTSNPGGESRTVEIERRDGVIERVQGHFWPFSHLDGGTLLVPDPEGDIVGARLL